MFFLQVAVMLSVASIAEYEKKVEVLEKSIVSVPDFPKEGILFRDITTLLENPDAFRLSIELLRDMCADEKPDYIVAADARGFLFGAALSYELGVGLVLVRKKGKLPRQTYSKEYTLEYGSNTLEICRDSLKSGDKVLLIDDLLATGGTAGAMIDLVRMTGAKILSFAFIIELFDLGGAKLIEDKYGVNVQSLVKFPGH
ncbi:MAG: adenine phosphoribosyltransferase [Succinivibrio sp.]